MQSAPGSELAHDDEGGFFAEINITPLTDVFLVLLIILMVVSTSVIESEKEDAYEKGLLAERALQVMTPSADSESEIVAEDVVISVLPDRTIFIENEEVPIASFDVRLAALRQSNPSVRIVLRGDVNASYEVIMDVIARCSRSGLRNIALATRDGE